MISSPVNVALTLAFCVTGLYCLFHLVSTRRVETAVGSKALSDEHVVDINHVIMSAAMILMTWVMIDDVLLWAQVILFAVLALSLVPNLQRAGVARARIDVLGHLLLDAAMIWMLAAMPLLMAGMDHSDGSGHGDHGGHGGHGGHDMDMSTAVTPAWADVVNVGFVVICGVAALWWLLQVVKVSRHRWHSACHALMAVAMGVMLVAMNA